MYLSVGKILGLGGSVNQGIKTYLYAMTHKGDIFLLYICGAKQSAAIIESHFTKFACNLFFAYKSECYGTAQKSKFVQNQSRLE